MGVERGGFRPEALFVVLLEREMAVLLVLVGAALVALVIVLVAVHRTRPERFTLGVRTKWGTVGVEVERPFYRDSRDPGGGP